MVYRKMINSKNILICEEDFFCQANLLISPSDFRDLKRSMSARRNRAFRSTNLPEDLANKVFFLIRLNLYQPLLIYKPLDVFQNSDSWIT